MTLECRKIYKKYSKGSIVLDNVSFLVRSGVVGLLGANGAGKTTLLKVLASQILYDKGCVMFGGKNIYDDIVGYRKALGYLPQEFDFPEGFTVTEILTYIARLKLIDKADAKNQISYLLKELNLLEKRHKKIKELSKGMKQRLGVAQAFLGEPQLIILDEPTVNLDIEEKQNLLNFIARQTKATVIISSHIVQEIERVCSSLIIMDKGKTLYHGQVLELLASMNGHVFETTRDTATIDEDIIEGMPLSSCIVDAKERIRVYSPSPLRNHYFPVKPEVEDAYFLLKKGVQP